MENLSIEELQAKNQEGETLLHLATIPGNLERVKYLLESGLEVNAVTNFWHTPLHYAVNFGWFEIAKFLIEKGAKVNALTNFDYSPLQYSKIINRKRDSFKYTKYVWADCFALCGKSSEV